MTELEQYKRAYANLVGQVDTVICNLDIAIRVKNQELAALAVAKSELIAALQEAEEIFLEGDPEDV